MELLKSENGESIQILHYENGQKYEPHFDFFHDKVNQELGGHRIATVLMYLSNVEKGGETIFPNSEVWQWFCYFGAFVFWKTVIYFIFVANCDYFVFCSLKNLKKRMTAGLIVLIRVMQVGNCYWFIFMSIDHESSM